MLLSNLLRNIIRHPGGAIAFILAVCATGWRPNVAPKATSGFAMQADTTDNAAAPVVTIRRHRNRNRRAKSSALTAVQVSEISPHTGAGTVEVAASATGPKDDGQNPEAEQVHIETSSPHTSAGQVQVSEISPHTGAGTVAESATGQTEDGQNPEAEQASQPASLVEVLKKDAEQTAFQAARAQVNARAASAFVADASVDASTAPGQALGPGEYKAFCEKLTTCTSKNKKNHALACLTEAMDGFSSEIAEARGLVDALKVLVASMSAENWETEIPKVQEAVKGTHVQNAPECEDFRSLLEAKAKAAQEAAAKAAPEDKEGEEDKEAKAPAPKAETTEEEEVPPAPVVQDYCKDFNDSCNKGKVIRPKECKDTPCSKTDCCQVDVGGFTKFGIENKDQWKKKQADAKAAEEADAAAKEAKAKGKK